MAAWADLMVSYALTRGEDTEFLPGGTEEYEFPRGLTPPQSPKSAPRLRRPRLHLHPRCSHTSARSPAPASATHTFVAGDLLRGLSGLAVNSFALAPPEASCIRM